MSFILYFEKLYRFWLLFNFLLIQPVFYHVPDIMVLVGCSISICLLKGKKWTRNICGWWCKQAPIVDLQDGLVSGAIGVAGQPFIEKGWFVAIEEVMGGHSC